MWVQYTTGKDSFRSVGVSPKRNVSVQLYTRTEQVPDQPILPLFAAFQKKLKGFGKTSLVQTIPATSRFSENDAGQWFVSRSEVAPGTEILIEYRHRSTRGFGENIEYLLAIADPHSPLWRLRLDLPMHSLSAVPEVFFEGRFLLVTEDKQLPKGSAKTWMKFLGIDLEPGTQFADYLDPSMPDEDKAFFYMELEAAPVVQKAIEVVETSEGKTRLRFKRGRKIKVR